MAISGNKIILALDIGSSSVRCSAYSLALVVNKNNVDDDLGSPQVQALVGCSSSRPNAIVVQTSGRIVLATKTKQGDLLDDIDICVDETLERIRNSYDEFQIVAVAISTLVMNFIGIDMEGHVVDGATISYACNSKKVSDECILLQKLIQPEQRKVLYQRTGCPLHSAYALPQLRIFYKKEANTSVAVHTWQTIASLVLCRWTGRTSLPISFSEASWTGLLNIHTCEWDMEILSYLPKSCQDALPLLADSIDTSAVLGGIGEYCVTTTTTNNNNYNERRKNPYWLRWPELRGDDASITTNSNGSSPCKLFLGLGDGAAANLGSKCTSLSRIAVTVGTSAAARVCLWYPSTKSMSLPSRQHCNEDGDYNSTITIPAGLWCYRITKDLVLLGGALTDGGNVIEFCRNLLNLKGDTEFTTILEEIGKLMQQDEEKHNNYNNEKQERQSTSNNSDHDDSSISTHSETFLPFLSGERSTGFRFGATAAMCGITKDTTPARFVKSCMEGVTVRLNVILKLIHTISSFNELLAKGSSTILVVSGSALEKNAIWRQMIANCSGMVVIKDSEVNECTSRGAALLAAAALCSSTTSSNRFFFQDETLTPIAVCKPSSPATTKHWVVQSRIQNELIDAISSTWLPCQDFP